MARREGRACLRVLRVEESGHALEEEVEVEGGSEERLRDGGGLRLLARAARVREQPLSERGHPRAEEVEGGRDGAHVMDGGLEEEDFDEERVEVRHAEQLVGELDERL